MDNTDRQVPLIATSPAQRATRRARPVVLSLAVLVVLVVPALLLLPAGPVLSGIKGSALLALAGLVLALRKANGAMNPVQGASPALCAIVFAELFVIGGSAIHYFTSLLLAPLLDAPEQPTLTLLWAVSTAIPAAAFLAWATSPVTPRPPN